MHELLSPAERLFAISGILHNAGPEADLSALVFRYYQGRGLSVSDVAQVSTYAHSNMHWGEHASHLANYLRYSQHPQATVEAWFYGIVSKSAMKPLAALHLALSTLYTL